MNLFSVSLQYYYPKQYIYINNSLNYLLYYGYHFEMSRQVLIYGDSHVARLKVAIDDIDTPLLTDFGVDQAMGQIEFIGRRGGHISDIYNDMLVIQSIKPQIIFLQIAGNDISGDKNNVHEVVNSMMEVVQLLASMSFVKVVYIGQLLYRFPGRYLSEVQAQQYQQNVKAANAMITDRVSHINEAHVLWWKIEGVKKPSLPVMHTDGVHFNEIGMKFFFKAIRNALIHGFHKSKSLPNTSQIKRS